MITIIGILASLIGAAAVKAIGSAQKTRIDTEIDQMALALQTYKDTNGSYPPNAQTDDATPSPANPINETQVVLDLRRHLKQAFGRSSEPKYLIDALAGMASTSPEVAHNLAGGMSAGEALVFWLGGFSDVPEYPISGEGGPSYRIDTLTPPATADTADPIDSRKWVYPFEVARLQPRNADRYFDSSTERYIVYEVTVNGERQTRRINFWQYVPAQSEQPYLYFDTSRHEAEPTFDPPAATSMNPSSLVVYAVKKRSESTGAAVPIEFANRDKFQILHCGVDEEWGDFRPMWSGSTNPLLYPDGPFTGDVADTLSSFSEGTLEDSQP